MPKIEGWQTIEQHEEVIKQIRKRTKEYMATHESPSYEICLLYYSEATYLHTDHPNSSKFLEVSKYAREWSEYLFRSTGDDWYKLYMSTLLLEAPYRFESFMLYIEHERPDDKQFYLPRREILTPVVNDLQRLEDDDLKFYGLSMPARTGKSTICIFFLAWIMGRRPNSHNAMCGHSGILAQGFYEELLNIIEGQEYCYGNVFPNLYKKGKLVQKKSAEQFTINLGAPKRFSTFTARGIDGTWTGAIDISKDGYLYVDDLVRDRQHSLSPKRMDDTFNEYLNKCVDRKNDGAKELMVGTLWSVLDPLSRLSIKFANDPRYMFRRMPALDENDESNFKYLVNGFSTEYYHEMRDRLEKPEWMAKFMQQPFVREGLLFEEAELTFFDGLIRKDQEGEFHAVCDPAFGGGDSLSMPIGFKIEDKVYIVDWVFSNATTDVTVPMVANAIMKYGIKAMTFEKNNGGDLYCQRVKDYLSERGYSCAMECKPAPNKISKIDKIKGYASEIKSKFIFLDNSQHKYDKEDISEYDLYQRTTQYNQALSEMMTFVTVGRNLHDDAADGITMLAIDIFGYLSERTNSVSAVYNPFWR